MILSCISSFLVHLNSSLFLVLCTARNLSGEGIGLGRLPISVWQAIIKFIMWILMLRKKKSNSGNLATRKMILPLSHVWSKINMRMCIMFIGCRIKRYSGVHIIPVCITLKHTYIDFFVYKMQSSVSLPCKFTCGFIGFAAWSHSCQLILLIYCNLILLFIQINKFWYWRKIVPKTIFVHFEMEGCGWGFMRSRYSWNFSMLPIPCVTDVFSFDLFFLLIGDFLVFLS